MAIALAMSQMAVADEHVHATVPLTAPSIKIDINPEARVSATLSGALPPPVLCGTPAVLSVKIVNRGFVTAALEAEFVGQFEGALLDFHPQPLKGVPNELRTLRITLMKPGPVDLTIAFKAHNEIPDLGGRDRIHFLMGCLPDVRA
ncbi:MAG TPA: hypothetical protein VGI93_20885 [Steroidobacteraceae bacterium]